MMEYTTSDKEFVGAGQVDKLLINKYLPHYYCYLFAIYNFKFDKSIIIDFIKNAPNIKNKGIYNKRLKPFGFGKDELFINEYMMYDNSFENIKGVKIGILLNYDINWFLYYYKKELLEDMASFTYSNLKFILGKFYEPNMTSEQMFNLIDKFTYRIKSNNSNKIYISERFSELIKELDSKNLEWFSLEHIKLINKNFSNIVDCVSILYYNPVNLNILTVKIVEKNILT